jgi:hypothetical protein
MIGGSREDRARHGLPRYSSHSVILNHLAIERNDPEPYPCPSSMPFMALTIFRSRNVSSSASSRKTAALCGGVFEYAAQVIPPTCHVFCVIDADLSRSRRGIAEKSHL